MSFEQDPSSSEAKFIQSQFREYAELALDKLPLQFLGDEAESLRQDVEVIYCEGSDKGDVVPVVSCDFMQRKLLLIVEQGSILEFAEKFVEEAETSDFSEADIVRLLVGAGVARSILAWKLLPIVGDDVTQEEKEQIQDRICDKKGLWELVDAYDTEHKTDLRPSVEKLNDDQVSLVNTLRFAIGASLDYLSDVHDVQIEVPKSFVFRLNEQELARRLDLRTYMAILDQGSAYELYEDAAPLLSYALSFPMCPGEQQAL